MNPTSDVHEHAPARSSGASHVPTVEYWHLWTDAQRVHCIDPGGRLLGKIRVPYRVSNLTFGGALKNRLFIGGSHTLYAIYLNRRGVRWP